MISTSSFQQGLIDSSSTSNDTNGSTSVTTNGLLSTAGQSQSGLVVFGGVSDDGGVVARGTGESTTVTCFLFDIADDGTFGELGDGEDVSDVQSGLLAAVNESTGVETFGGNEGFLTELVTVGITEDNSGEGSTTVI